MASRNVSNHFGVNGIWLYISLMVANSTAMLLFGYDQGVFGGILTIEGFEARFEIQGNEALKGVIVGSYDLGCLVGALATGTIGGMIGRKRSILLGTTIMLIGAFLQFLAPNFGTMTAGRVIAGIGNGMNTSTAPVWASETCKTARRGRTGMTLMVVNIGGLALSCWMTYLFSFVRSELAWRFPLAFQLFFVLIIYLTTFWLPESPRWLIMKRRDEEAFRNIVALEGGSTTSASTIAKEDFDEIKISIALEQSTDVKRQTMPWFRLILGIGAQAMQQLTAINIICYYLPYVLTESVGIAGALARLLAAVNAMSYLGCTFIGLYLIERWGRRRLMMFGAAGQCCCWLAITILLKFASSAAIFSIRQRQLGGAAVFFFFLFNCFFGIGWQGVSWLYPTEINSTQNRIAGMSYGVATNWLINFGVVFVTPVGIAKLGWHFYVIWTVLNALMVPLIWLFYPETAGRSLEDIDRMFEANPSVWVFTAKSMTSRKPQTSASCGISGDEAGPSDRTEEIPISFGIENAPTIAFSRQASAIELSALGGLRHRQLGPLAGTSSTSVEDVATALDGRGENAEVVFDPVPCDTNDEGEGEGIAMARAATVLSAQSAPTLGTQMSTTPLL